MLKLHYDIDIAASAETVWHALFDPENYRAWTKVFDPGSHYVGSFDAEGNRLHFISESGAGMYSELERLIPNEEAVIRHIGVLEPEGTELPITKEAEKWSGSRESYRLVPIDGGVRLQATLDAEEEFVESMNTIFPEALAIVKTLAEEHGSVRSDG